MKELRWEPSKKRTYYFIYSILFISIAYFLFEYWFVFYGALAPDEFVFTRHIYEYTFSIPYRDFPPYKTVLGYYILSIPLFFSHALLSPMFYIKNEIALLNALFIVLASLWGTRFFDRRAIFLTLLAAMVNGMFLIYSTDLRVDMLTSWACLFAIFAVMENRLKLGGIIVSIAFLISQKAIWYLLAINGAMLICWLVLPYSIYRGRAFIVFNLTVLLSIAAYILFWSSFAGPKAVLSNMFYDAYVQEGINVYLAGYLICWQAVLIRGALLFLLWPVVFLSLFDTSSNANFNHKNIFVICCASFALELFLDYKQPFPYNFVFTVPALFLLYNQFFTWLFEQKEKAHYFSINFQSLSFIFTTFFYFYFVGAIIYFLMLPEINYLALPLIAALLAYLWLWRDRPGIRLINLSIVLILFTIGAIVYPLYRSMLTASILDGSYQRHMLTTAAKILQPDNSDYIGGIPFFYQKDQPIAGMRNLIEPAAKYLENPDVELGRLLLPSLYLLPTSQEKVLAEFDQYPVKVILDNYRFDVIPKKIKDYIADHYQQFYGSILLYAPLIHAGNHPFDLKFQANYRVDANQTIIIDHKKILPGQIIQLSNGRHHSQSKHAYRLALIPDGVSKSLDPQFHQNAKLRMMKAIIA